MENQSNNNIVRISKFLSLILRHSPEKIHLNIDKNGWANIQELIENANKYKNIQLTIELIKEVVEKNDKKRFIISEDGERIRANQGHSIKIDLELESKIPPDILYHGTSSRFLDSIMKEGLRPMTRQYVHFSTDEETALKVGKRHGRPLILQVDAKKMHEDGYKFYVSENGIWLTEKAPVKYLKKYKPI